MGDSNNAGQIPAEENRLIRLFARGDEWYSNADIVEALKGPGVSLNQMPVGASAKWLLSLGKETRLSRLTDASGREVGQKFRMYSRKGLCLIAMRAQTPTAEGFRHWMAERIARG